MSDRGARTLLVVGGGVESVPGIERVRALGPRVAVVDGNPDAPGLALADVPVVASTYDAEAVVQAARGLRRRGGLDGVLSIAVDVPRTVAAVAAELGLPGLSPEAARVATDKLLLKEALAGAGVPVPWGVEVASAEELAARMEERGPPLVLKPVDGRGARGVLRLDAGADLAQAWEHARSRSPSGRCLVEEYLEGPQLSSESVLLEGRATTLACSDRNYARLEELAPHVIEDGGLQPSVHVPGVLPAVDALAERAAAALGLRDGTLKGDLVLHPERGLCAVEVAPRLSGGWLCTDQVPWSTGVDIVAVAARLALGERPAPEEVRPRSWRPVAVRYLFPPQGVVRAVRGFDEVAARPWVLRAMLYARPGDRVGPPADHTARAGCVLATGATREEAVRRAEEAVRDVQIEVEPAPASSPPRSPARP